LGALGQGLQYRQQRKNLEAGKEEALNAAQTEADKLEALKMQAMQAVQSGDRDALLQLSLDNPALGKIASEEIGFRDETTKQNYISLLFEAKKDPSKIPALVASRKAYLKSQGQEDMDFTSNLEENWRNDPDTIQDEIDNDLIALAPDRFAQYKDLTAEPEVDQTNDVQNFEYYAQLYETNPDMADKFAVQVGISPADNYESLMAELQMMKLRQEVTAGETEASDKVTAKEAGKKASIESKKSKSIELNRTISQIDEIVKTVESSFAPTTGLMGMVSGAIPGTEAYGVRGDVEMIKGKLGLDMIKEMKQQSSTGATGFGAMSEKELALIQSAVDRLDPNMDSDRFLQAMAEIKGHYQLWKEYNDKALVEEARMASEGTANKSGIRSIGVLQGLQTSEMSDAELEAFIKANK